MLWKHPIDPPKDLFDLTKIEVITIFGGRSTVILTFAPNDQDSEIEPFTLKFDRPNIQAGHELAKYYQQRYAKQDNSN